MNITELARILKITPKELRDHLPTMGFHIGQKAIKINRNEANKIIKNWPVMIRKIEDQKREEEEKNKLKEKEVKEKKKIEIPRLITVRDLANISGVTVNVILTELMKNGIFSSLNEKIDFETAWLISNEIGVEVKLKKDQDGEIKQDENKLKNILGKEAKEKMLPRPPVIVVMGHVDHGKTKLLDAIRSTNIIDGEAGGITQHIGAYQVTRRKKLITFVDTPGHEAFTAMRSRGAKIADIAILVVAADDGVKPQTIEAYKIIQAAKIPFVVAINKIDKEGANVEKTKQELANQLNIVPEDWGGKVVFVPISAKVGTGVVELLDMVLLVADTENENIVANPDTDAVGTVVESHIDKGAGPVATILIQNGTLRIGDQLTLDNKIIGKIRNLNNYREEKVEKAEPSMPVQIIGLKMMPQVGDVLEVGEGEKVKYRKSSNSIKTFMPQSGSDEEEALVAKVNVIIKSDVMGSVEAIEESLLKINTDEVKVRVIHKGLGNITDGDVKRAEVSKAIILGFNVKVLPAIEELAREKNVTISRYTIIYDLINEVKQKMQAAIKPKYIRADLGRLKVLAIFKTERNEQIIGGKVLDGSIESDAKFEIIRKKEVVGEGKILKLQSGKQDVNLVNTDEECGIKCEGKAIIEEGDILQFFKEEQVISKIK